MSSFPKAMPHHGLVRILDDAWYVQGSVDMKPFVRLQRNMVVLRHEGQLTLINSVRMDEAGEAALLALGEVAHVVKIGIHGMDDAYCADRFSAKRWATPGLADDVAEPLSSDSLPHPKLSLFLFEHTKEPEAALLLDSDGGLLITCDSVQHWEPSDLMSLPAKLLTRLMGFQHPAQIGPPWRKMMTTAGGSLKPDFERLASLGFTRLIGGHGGLCDGDAPAQLRATMARVF